MRDASQPTLIETPTTFEVEFRRFLEKLPAAAYTCDRAGLLTYFNRRAAEVWGREPKLLDPEQRFCGSHRLFTTEGDPIRHEQCSMAQALRTGEEFNAQEVVIERADGSRVTVLVHVNPLRDELGTLTGAVNVMVDISDRKRAESDLVEADRRKDEFLAILAHELRNPLAPMSNALQILRQELGHSARVEQACSMMERQVQQMVRLVDDLMDVSRIVRNRVALRKERLELASVVRSAVEATRGSFEAANHELAVRLPAQPIHLEGDATRLVQVFANLLDNAAKYTERPGRISLTAERQGDAAVVKVRDTGVGIPAEMLGRIFDIFMQVDRSLERAQGGLGIGLSLVRGLVELHGGTVEAHSEGPGRGSEFIVRLPAVVESGPQAMPSADRVAPARLPADCRILVVDDNQDSAASLSIMLKRIARHVRTAHDGLEAVEVAELFDPDVMLLDIGLPKLNGYDAARRIRAAPWGKRMFLIAVTGWGQDEDKRRSAEAGFDLHMVKPVDPSALEKLIAELHRTPA